MGILDFLSGEFIDVIHWTDDTRDTMVWRFERQGHAIKYGAKLTVREGQAAVFVHEGQLADVFTPGLYMLETNNMPILTTLQHWDHGFRSPFKSEIYFVNTTRFNDLKWGTKNPIMLRDPEFGPTRIRAYGTYTVRVKDPAKFLIEIVGTDGEFTMDEISFQIRNIIVQEFSRTIARAGIPVLDMAANTRELGHLIARDIEPKLAVCPNPDKHETPDMLLMLSDGLGVFDNLSSRMFLIVHVDPAEKDAWQQGQRQLDELEARLRATTRGASTGAARRAAARWSPRSTTPPACCAPSSRSSARRNVKNRN